jgi:hypothetical protein
MDSTTRDSAAGYSRTHVRFILVRLAVSEPRQIRALHPAKTKKQDLGSNNGPDDFCDPVIIPNVKRHGNVT